MKKQRYYKYKVSYYRTAACNTIYTHCYVFAPSLKVAKYEASEWERYSNQPGVIVKVTSIKRA